MMLCSVLSTVRVIVLMKHDCCDVELLEVLNKLKKLLLKHLDQLVELVVDNGSICDLLYTKVTMCMLHGEKIILRDEDLVAQWTADNVFTRVTQKS